MYAKKGYPKTVKGSIVAAFPAEREKSLLHSTCIVCTTIAADRYVYEEELKCREKIKRKRYMSFSAQLSLLKSACLICCYADSYRCSGFSDFSGFSGFFHACFRLSSFQKYTCYRILCSYFYWFLSFFSPPQRIFCAHHVKL